MSYSGLTAPQSFGKLIAKAPFLLSVQTDCATKHKQNKMGLFFLSPPVTIAIMGVVVGASIAYHVTKNMKDERMQMEALVTSLKELVTEERRLKQEREDRDEEEISHSRRLEARGKGSGFRSFDVADDDDDLYTSPSNSPSASKSSVHQVRRVSNPTSDLNTGSDTDNMEQSASEVISDIDDYEEISYVSSPLKRKRIKQT